MCVEPAPLSAAHRDPNETALAMDVEPVLPGRDMLAEELEEVMDDSVQQALRESALLAATVADQEADEAAALATAIGESIAAHCRDEGVTSSGSGLKPWERPPFPDAATAAATAH